MSCQKVSFTRLKKITNLEEYEVVTMNINSPAKNGNNLITENERVRKISRRQSIREDILTGKKKEEYLRSLSIHGLGKICRGSKAESIFWLAVFFFGLAITSFLVHRLVTKYLKYEIYTEFYQRNEMYNGFPSVTFCNEALLLGNYFKYCGNQNTLGLDEPCQQKEVTDFQSKSNILKETQKEWSNGYFHVRLCQSAGNEICATDDHLLSASKHNHACFIWNHNGSFHDVYNQVSLQFALNKSSKIGQGKIIAFVHDPQITEVDYTNSISLEPSRTYQLRIRKTQIIRLSSPFPSKCVHNVNQQIYPGKYSRRNCIDSINYINMYKKCGDVMDYHRRLMPKHIVTKYKKNISIKEAVACFRSFSQTKVQISDECPYPCEEMEYHTTAMCHQLDSFNDKPDDQIYRLEIQLQNINSYDVIEEKQLYTWDQMLGESGGLLGLLIGASIISFIEILAYFYLAAIQKCVKACSK